MDQDRHRIHRVTSYLTSSDYVTVFDGKKNRSLYRFNPDLSQGDRKTVLKHLRYGADVGQFLGCGDLLTVKPKP